MLEVIQHEQHLLIAQDVQQRGGGVGVIEGGADGASDGHREPVRGGERGQPDEPHPIGVGVYRGGRRLQRQARLAHAARAYQAQQARARLLPQGGQFGQLRRAPHKRGEGSGQVIAWRAARRAGRRGIAGADAG